MFVSRMQPSRKRSGCGIIGPAAILHHALLHHTLLCKFASFLHMNKLLQSSETDDCKFAKKQTHAGALIGTAGIPATAGIQATPITMTHAGTLIATAGMPATRKYTRKHTCMQALTQFDAAICEVLLKNTNVLIHLYRSRFIGGTKPTGKHTLATLYGHACGRNCDHNSVSTQCKNDLSYSLHSCTIVMHQHDASGRRRHWHSIPASRRRRHWHSIR